MPVALYRPEPTFQLPITPCGVLPLLILTVILEIEGAAHEGAGGKSGHAVKIGQVLGKIFVGERQRPAELVLARGKLARRAHGAGKGETARRNAPIEFADGKVAGARIEIPVHVQVAGGDVGLPSVVAEIGGDVADDMTTVRGARIGRQIAVVDHVARHPPAEMDVVDIERPVVIAEVHPRPEGAPLQEVAILADRLVAARAEGFGEEFGDVELIAAHQIAGGGDVLVIDRATFAEEVEDRRPLHAFDGGVMLVVDIGGTFAVAAEAESIGFGRAVMIADIAHRDAGAQRVGARIEIDREVVGRGAGDRVLEIGSWYLRLHHSGGVAGIGTRQSLRRHLVAVPADADVIGRAGFLLRRLAAGNERRALADDVTSRWNRSRSRSWDSLRRGNAIRRGHRASRCCR